MPKENNTVPNEEQDNVFDDNFDFGSLEEPETEEEADDEVDAEETDNDSEESEDTKPAKTDSSAIHQKKRYRDLYKQSQDRIKELEQQVNQGKQLSAEEQKEKQAEEFLSVKIREVLERMDAEKRQEQTEETEKFQTELEEVLDENSNFTEEQILAVTEELGISPRQAIKVIERERKLTKRAKPQVPKEKRAATKATPNQENKTEGKNTLDQVNRRIKDMLGRGEL